MKNVTSPFYCVRFTSTFVYEGSVAAVSVTFTPRVLWTQTAGTDTEHMLKYTKWYQSKFNAYDLGQCISALERKITMPINEKNY